MKWRSLDDGVMGGRSKTTLASDSSLHFAGTIDTQASVGWASTRASLTPGLLPDNMDAIAIKARGDGKTYKILLHDADHERSGSDQTPLWETDLTTKKDGSVVETTLPLRSFTPSFMARQLSGEERKRFQLSPSAITKVGVMLSSRLSDGSRNPVDTYGTGIFEFSLFVDSLEPVVGGEKK